MPGRMLGFAALLGCFCAAGMARAAGPVPVPSAATLAPDPYGVGLVGKSLIAFGLDRRMWRRDLDGGGWRMLPQLPGEAQATPIGFTCVNDPSGMCIITWRDKDGVQFDFYDIARDGLKRLALNGANVAVVSDSDTLLVTRPDTSGGSVLSAWHIHDGSETRIGGLRKGEQLLTIPLDGEKAPVAAMPNGRFRLVSDAPETVEFSLDTIENMITIKDGWIGRELWSHTPPAIPDRRAFYELHFSRAVRDGHPAIDIKGTVIAAFPTAQFLPDERNGAVDAAGDLISAFIGPQGTRLGYFCRNEEGVPSVNFFYTQEPGETVNVMGSLAASGFLLQKTGLLHTNAYDVVELSPASGGWRGRKCAYTTVTHRDTGIAVDTPGMFDLVEGKAASSGGVSVPYILLVPKGGVPQHVIIDVYGSYGFVRSYEMYHDKTHELLAKTRTAIAFPIVRGDGNLGYDYALASRTPNRQLAVDDVAAVAKDIMTRYPALASKPAVRGMSAGGWLAMRAALSRPDLFSGAMGYSGGYLFRDGDRITDQGNGLSYFSPADNLTATVDGLHGDCHGQHFRILHAKDDNRVSYADAEAFAALLDKQGCKAEFVGFESGGHNIDVPLDRAGDAERRLNAYFTPF